jgi:hypothetical protein
VRNFHIAGVALMASRLRAVARDTVDKLRRYFLQSALYQFSLHLVQSEVAFPLRLGCAPLEISKTVAKKRQLIGRNLGCRQVIDDGFRILLVFSS